MRADPFKVNYTAKDIYDEFLDLFHFLNHGDPYPPLWVMQAVMAQTEHWAEVARLDGHDLVVQP